MASTLITFTAFQDAYERGGLDDVYYIVKGSAKQVYGKLREGQNINPKGFLAVYAVVP
jgi:uncharacterized RmlC-like cupin family protein